MLGAGRLMEMLLTSCFHSIWCFEQFYLSFGILFEINLNVNQSRGLVWQTDIGRIAPFILNHIQ